MNPIYKKNKLVVIILVFSLTFTSFFSLFPTKKAEAVLPVIDITLIEYLTSTFSGLTPSVFNGMAITEDTNPLSIKNIGKFALKRILRELTKSTVDWIDSGFEGNPAFITNTSEFLRDTADITIGDFLMNDPALSFLCDPFKIQVKLALGLQYRPFKEQIQCSFTSALGNVNDAMNNFMNGDFIGGGGWDSWLQLTTVPQNNQMGAMILAQAELDARIESSKDIAIKEADWGGGFMSWKDCPPSDPNTEAMGDDAVRARYAYVTKQERGDDGCVIKTPGGVIANKINWVDTSTLRELELADDINAIVSALLNQLLTLGIQSISDSGLLGSGKKTQDNSYNEYMSYLNNLDSQYSNSSASVNSPSYNSNSNTNNNDYYTQDGEINFDQTFANKAITLEAIESQITIETNYFTAQNNIFQLLTATQNAFTISICPATVKTEISSQITGQYNGTKDLIWNNQDISRDSALATSNLSALNEVKTAITNSQNDSAIPSLTRSLPNTFHSAEAIASYSAGGESFNQIKTWVVSKINNNKACVGDISALGAWGIE